MSPVKRFTTAPLRGYVMVVDGETGAQWAYLNEAAAQAAADAANDDPTHMRDTNQTSAPPTIA